MQSAAPRVRVGGTRLQCGVGTAHRVTIFSKITGLWVFSWLLSFLSWHGFPGWSFSKHTGHLALARGGLGASFWTSGAALAFASGSSRSWGFFLRLGRWEESLGET